MKRTLLCIGLLLLLTALVPLLCLFTLPPAPGQAVQSRAAPSAVSAPSAAVSSPAAQPTPTVQPDSVLLWDQDSETLLTVPLLDYLIGAAACEMPANWPDQAILSQMIASHSYLLYCRDHPDARCQGGWVAVNTALRQGYADCALLQSYWGTAYAENHARFEALAQQVAHTVLLYEGAPAAACYHAISCGHTQASQRVWEQALPYLQGVDSTLDLASPDYAVTVEWSRQQMSDALENVLGITPEGSPEDWLSDPEWDDAGYIAQLSVCGQPVSGTAFRKALSLRSACFSWEYGDDRFLLTTHGYGHGVGLSQYGAYAMALTGSSWQDILAAYFPGTVPGSVG